MFLLILSSTVLILDQLVGTWLRWNRGWVYGRLEVRMRSGGYPVWQESIIRDVQAALWWPWLTGQ